MYKTTEHIYSTDPPLTIIPDGDNYLTDIYVSVSSGDVHLNDDAETIPSP